jgi:flagellar assembly protein FliH
MSGTGAAGSQPKVPEGLSPFEEFDRGLKQGREDARRELIPTLNTLHQLIQSLQGQAQEHKIVLDRFATNLALRIAEQIIEREVAHPDVVRKMIATALSQIPIKNGLTLRIHPEDARMLEGLRGQILSGKTLLPENVHLIADASIARGGCSADTQAGNLDAKIETQLELLRKTLVPDEE